MSESNNSFKIEIRPTFNFSLQNILSDEEVLKVSSNNQIFFIETKMESEKIRNLTNARQACSVESAGEKNY
jgi:hypothetical protein